MVLTNKAPAYESVTQETLFVKISLIHTTLVETLSKLSLMKGYDKHYLMHNARTYVDEMYRNVIVCITDGKDLQVGVAKLQF